MRRVHLTASLLFLFALPSIAYACSCVHSDPAMAFNDSQAVFIGRMLGGTEKLSYQDSAGKSYPIEAGKVRFSVEEVFKGKLTSETTIEVASMADTSCGPYGLERRQRFIVYAYGNDRDSKLSTGVCTRTRNVESEYAQDDLTFLRNLPPAGTGGTIRGRVWADLRAGGATPLVNIKVSIRGPDEFAKTIVSGTEGEFELTKLKAGVYTVEPQFPPNYTSDRSSTEVTVDDRGTATVGFEAYIDGKVTGQVLDRDGQAVNSIFLHLESGENSVYGHSTGENGAFKAKGVPPGEYVLFLELNAADSKNNRNYYYPGTFERAEAKPIKVGLGETVENLTFLLPEEFRVRSIEGQVTWPDGKPAAQVEVFLVCARGAKQNGYAVEFMPPRDITDDRGRFRIEGFTSESYVLEARASRAGQKESETSYWHSPTRKLVIKEDLKDVKLVLSEKGFSGRCNDK